jgi:AcrR family transcriptional regulator
MLLLNERSIGMAQYRMAIKDKRETILQAAMQLIAERGFHSAPMSMVAQRAGVSAGIIYHYFASKEDLIHALYQHVSADFNRALLAGDPQSLPLREAFICIWLNAYHFYRSNSAEARFLEQYKSSPFHQEPAEAPELVLGQDFAFIGKVLAIDPAQRPIKNLPFDVIYELTLGVAARVAHRHTHNNQIVDAAVLTEIATACWQAIAR